MVYFSPTLLPGFFILSHLTMVVLYVKMSVRLNGEDHSSVSIRPSFEKATLLNADIVIETFDGHLTGYTYENG